MQETMLPTRNGLDPDAELLRVAQSHVSRIHDEIERLTKERRLIDSQLASVQERLTALNTLIASYGGATQATDTKAETETDTAVPSRDGTRRSTLHLRRSGFEHVTLPEAILTVLPQDHDMHVDQLVAKVFDISSNEERQRVKNNVASTLVRGAVDGRWLKTGANRFQAATKEREQSALMEPALALS